MKQTHVIYEDKNNGDTTLTLELDGECIFATLIERNVGEPDRDVILTGVASIRLTAQLLGRFLKEHNL